MVAVTLPEYPASTVPAKQGGVRLDSEGQPFDSIRGREPIIGWLVGQARVHSQPDVPPVPEVPGTVPVLLDGQTTAEWGGNIWGETGVE